MGIPTGKGPAKRMRWLACGIGATVGGLWLLVGVLHTTGESEPWTWESTGIAIQIAAAALGGAILLIVAITFSTFAWITAGHNKGFAMLISGGPFLVAGVLFLVSWWIPRKGVVGGTDHDMGRDGHLD